MDNDTLQGNVRVYTTECSELETKSEIRGEIENEPSFILVDINKPYLINKCQIECVVGEWDKDKSRYGVRVFFASGNSVWCEGAAGRSLLKELAGYSPYLEYGYTALGDDAVKKFDEASKR